MDSNHAMLYSLPANTNYDFVGVTLLDGDLDPFTSGFIASDSANISAATDLTDTLAPGGSFDFGVSALALLSLLLPSVLDTNLPVPCAAVFHSSTGIPLPS